MTYFMAAHHEPTELGLLLRQAREQLGLSIRQVASKAGVHHSFLARLESGETLQPAPSLATRLATVLELDVSEVLAVIGIEQPLPEARVYLRRKFGFSADEAEVLARLIEDYQSEHHPVDSKPAEQAKDASNDQ